MVLEAYEAGHLDFGENKVQDLASKAEVLPRGIRWHMIGHLQRNKVKYIAPFVYLIHGVDSAKLVAEIDKRAIQNDRIIDILFQVHIATEESKFGWSTDELDEFVAGDLSGYSNIRVRGLMGMATNTSDESVVRTEFAGLKTYFDKLRESIPTMDTLSMGMSGDYEIAIDEGSNMIRVGSKIFGPREYANG